MKNEEIKIYERADNKGSRRRASSRHCSSERCSYKKVVTPEAKKACLVAIQEHGISERRACKLTRVNRSTVRYKDLENKEDELQKKIEEIAMEKIRYGYRRIHMILKRQGEKVNHKKVLRIYQGLRLKLMKKGGRKRAQGVR